MIISHIGVGLLILGITGSSVWQEENITRMKVNDETTINNYNIVFKEYHSKFRDELHFENKYKPYLFKLTNMVYKHKLNDFRFAFRTKIQTKNWNGRGALSSPRACRAWAQSGVHGGTG